MRISDWSSDVCSSDLPPRPAAARARVRRRCCVSSGRRRAPTGSRRSSPGSPVGAVAAAGGFLAPADRLDAFADQRRAAVDKPGVALHQRGAGGHFLARKSEVWGKSVAVRVDLGGLRVLKKKTL